MPKLSEPQIRTLRRLATGDPLRRSRMLRQRSVDGWSPWRWDAKPWRGPTRTTIDALIMGGLVVLVQNSKGWAQLLELTEAGKQAAK